MPAEPRRGRWIGESLVAQDLFDIARTDESEPDPRAAGSDRRQEARLAVGAQDDRDPRRRLLERLQKGGLGILVHPLGAFDDRDARRRPRPASGRARDQVADAPEPRTRPTDHDLPAGPGRLESVHVGMAAVLDEPARAARRHGRIDTSAVHRRPAARSSASVVLPTPSGPTTRTAWGTGPRIIAATTATAAGWPLRAEPVHLVRQPWSAAAAFRVVRRLVGVAGSAGVASAVASSGAAAVAAADLRGARGFRAGAAVSGATSPATSDADPEPAGDPSAPVDAASVAAFDDAVRRVARGLAAGFAVSAAAVSAGPWQQRRRGDDSVAVARPRRLSRRRPLQATSGCQPTAAPGRWPAFAWLEASSRSRKPKVQPQPLVGACRSRGDRLAVGVGRRRNVRTHDRLHRARRRRRAIRRRLRRTRRRLRAGSLRRSPGCRLLRDLGPEHRFELGRHVAPRLVRAATRARRRRTTLRPVAVTCGRPVTASLPIVAALALVAGRLAHLGRDRSRPGSG